MALLPDNNTKRPMYGDLDDEDIVFEDDDGDEDIIERPTPYYPGINVCIICQKKPPYSKGTKNYATCGLTCANILEQLKKTTPTQQPLQQQRQRISSDGRRIQRQYPDNTTNQPPAAFARKPALPCVVCHVGFCRHYSHVTCSVACAEKLCQNGSANPNMCNYCHRRPKVAGHDQCGMTCSKLAKNSCLLCKSRPKYKGYHLCGRICKTIATKTTPLILEAPAGHATFEFVKKKFQASWKLSSAAPTIKKVYKIIEGQNFLQPYDQYKKSVGNEVFRYHGTSRKCTLGSVGNTQLCANNTCPLCSILKTSFKTHLANPNGCFGPGVYSSSASNLSYGFTAGGAGVVLLTKVVLGNVRLVTAYHEVKACPPGFNSVVFDQNGASNETIVYSDDAIRPVFLITFQ